MLLAIVDFGASFAGFALREQQALNLWLFNALHLFGLALVSIMKTSCFQSSHTYSFVIFSRFTTPGRALRGGKAIAQNIINHSKVITSYRTFLYVLRLRRKRLLSMLLSLSL